MKRVVNLLILFFLLLVPFEIEAFDLNEEDCNWTEVVESGYKLSDTSCTYLTIDSYDYIDLFVEENTTLEVVSLVDEYFHDMSFLKNSKIEELKTFNATLNFDSFEGNVGAFNFNQTIIVDDDFSGFKNNKRNNINQVYFVSCWVDDFSTMPFDMITDMFSIKEHMSPYVNFESLGNYKGDIIEIDDVSYSISDDVVNTLLENGVSFNMDIASYKTNYNKFIDMYNAIDFTSEDLWVSDYHDIIAIEVGYQMDIVQESLNHDNVLEGYINGEGDSYSFAFATALMYRLRGLESFITSISHVDVQEYMPYYVAVVKENDVWNYADTYQLRYTDQLGEVVVGLGWYTVFFPEDYSLIEDEYNIVLSPNELFVYDSYITFKNYDGVYNFLKYSDEMTRAPLFIPERSGYKFEGWFTDSSFSTKVNSYSEIGPNTVLYAKWVSEEEANKGTNPGGGTIPNPGTGGFIILSIIVLCLALTAIVIINNKVFRRVFKI